MRRNFGMREVGECPPQKVAATSLGWLELGVALDEFFCAAAGEADGEAAVVFVAFDADDSADAIFGVANFAAEQGVGWGAARSRTAQAWRFRALTRCGRTLRGGATAYAAHEFFGGGGILGSGFIAAGRVVVSQSWAAWASDISGVLLCA